MADGQVAELEYALPLGGSTKRFEGSNPSLPTSHVYPPLAGHVGSNPTPGTTKEFLVILKTNMLIKYIPLLVITGITAGIFYMVVKNWRQKKVTIMTTGPIIDIATGRIISHDKLPRGYTKQGIVYTTDGTKNPSAFLIGMTIRILMLLGALLMTIKVALMTF